MNYKNCKNLFNYILEQNYIINKDSKNNDILYINYGNKDMKCKYLLLFSVDNNNNIIWSCDNPYVDQKTKYIISLIKKDILEKYKIKKILFDKDIEEKLKFLLKNNIKLIYDEEIINFMWIIKEKLKNYKNFYIINEIIFF